VLHLDRPDRPDVTPATVPMIGGDQISNQGEQTASPVDQHQRSSPAMSLQQPRVFNQLGRSTVGALHRR